MSRREPGYRPEPKIYRVTYDDHPGLIVRAKSVEASVFIELAELENTTPDKDDMLRVFGEFAKVLVSWNLEDQEGELVPTTLAGLLSQDFDLVLSIVLGWMEAVAGVPVPLDQPSSNGSPFQVESLPMEPLSLSRVS